MTWLSVVRRNWRAVLAFAAIAILATLLAVRTGQRDGARAALERERADHALFIERARAEAERVRADFEARARRIEQQQTSINQEVSRDYQARIADLHRRYAELLRGEGGANPGRPGPAPHLPTPGHPAGGADGAAGDPGLSLAERLVATETAIRLEALQEWVRAAGGGGMRGPSIVPAQSSGGSVQPTVAAHSFAPAMRMSNTGSLTA